MLSTCLRLAQVNPCVWISEKVAHNVLTAILSPMLSVVVISVVFEFLPKNNLIIKPSSAASVAPAICFKVV